jgi:hypothetical protein
MPVETGLNRFFVGLHKSEIVMDRRPDCGCGLDWSIIFPVFIGLGPVWSQLFCSLETGLPSTMRLGVAIFKIIPLPTGQPGLSFSKDITMMTTWPGVSIFQRTPLLMVWPGVQLFSFPTLRSGITISQEIPLLKVRLDVLIF